MNDLYEQINPSNLALVATDQGNFLFRFKPLVSQTPVGIDLVGAGVSTDFLDQERSFLPRLVGVLITASLIVLAIVGFLFAHSLVKSIKQLETAIVAMTNGDWNTRVGLRRQ